MNNRASKKEIAETLADRDYWRALATQLGFRAVYGFNFRDSALLIDGDGTRHEITRRLVDGLERALAAKGIATERETVERCAEIAETHLRCWGDTETETHGEDIAAAIRALSTPDPAPTKEPHDAGR